MSKFARQLAWMVAAFLSLGLTAQFASRDVACLGAQKGVRATIAALVIGVPVGIGTITLMLLATSLMGPMSSLTYVRQATKRTGEFAALGAIYGSMTGAVASGAEMTSLSGRPACQVDLLQTIGNGATWGTMVGFAAALFVMYRSLSEATSNAETKADRRLLIGLLATVMVVGVNWTVVITGALVLHLGQL